MIIYTIIYTTYHYATESIIRHNIMHARQDVTSITNLTSDIVIQVYTHFKGYN